MRSGVAGLAMLACFLAACSTQVVQLRDARATEVWVETPTGPVRLLSEAPRDDELRACEGPVAFAIRHSKTMTAERWAEVPKTSPPLEHASSSGRAAWISRYWDGEVRFGWSGRAVLPPTGTLWGGVPSAWPGDDRLVAIHITRSPARLEPRIAFIIVTPKSNVAGVSTTRVW
jgi:hypothetical protein